MSLNILREALISAGLVLISGYVGNFIDYIRSGFNSEVLFPIILSLFYFTPFIVLPVLLLFFSFVWFLIRPIVQKEEKYAKLYSVYSSSKGRIVCVIAALAVGFYFGL